MRYDSRIAKHGSANHQIADLDIVDCSNATRHVRAMFISDVHLGSRACKAEREYDGSQRGGDPHTVPFQGGFYAIRKPKNSAASSRFGWSSVSAVTSTSVSALAARSNRVTFTHCASHLDHQLRPAVFG